MYVYKAQHSVSFTSDIFCLFIVLGEFQIWRNLNTKIFDSLLFLLEYIFGMDYKVIR